MAPRSLAAGTPQGTPLGGPRVGPVVVRRRASCPSACEVSGTGRQAGDVKADMNRQRTIALGAVALFAAAVVGVAVFAGHDRSSTKSADSTKALAKLPVTPAATGAPGAAIARGGPDRPEPAVPPEYRVQGTLPTLAASAPAYRLAGPPSTADAGRLAAALGLHGAVQSADGQFVAADGTRRLVVPQTAGASWYYDDHPANADCPATASCGV